MQWPRLAYVITIFAALLVLLTSCAPTTTGGHTVPSTTAEPVYLADGSGHLRKFGTDGVEVTSGSWPITFTSMDARDVIVAANGDILVAYRDGPSTTYYVSRYQTDGTHLWTTAGETSSQIDALGELGGGTIVAGWDDGTIHAYDGSTGVELGSPYPLTPADSAVGAYYLAVDSNDNIYVAYSGDWKVHTWSSAGVESWVSSSMGGPPSALGLVGSYVYVGRGYRFGASDNYDVHQFDAATGAMDPNPGWPYTGHTYTIIGILDGGTDPITVSADDTSKVISAADGTVSRDTTLAETPYEAGIDSAGNTIYSGSSGTSDLIALDPSGVTIWDTVVGASGPMATSSVPTSSPLPPLDSPVRVDLSEDLTGRFADVGIQLDYLPNASIAKTVGEAAAISDQITTSEALYTFWIKTKAWRGGLVNYTGETVLGRLNDLEPPTLAQVGPFTATEALAAMLAHFQQAAGTWLTYAALPELVVQTDVGPYAPIINAVVLKQADPNDPTAKRITALDWLKQYLSLFEGYVLRANQAGELEIVAPWWATSGNSAYFGSSDAPTPITNAAGYTRSWAWSGTQAQLDLKIRGDGDRGLVMYHAEIVTAGTPNTYHNTQAADPYTVTWEITSGKLTLTITPDDPSVTKDYAVYGVATNPTPGTAVAKTIQASELLEGDDSELDVDYVANIVEVDSQGQDYVAGFEAWSPAYVDYNPKPVYPKNMGGYTGTAVQWTDSATRSTWLPDPGTGYGREKIATAWSLADPATIVEQGTPITLTLGFDAYWSAQPTDYIGNCIPTIQQIPPEAYPGSVAFTITDADGAVTTEGGGLPHTLADITLPADGREVTVHMESLRVGVSSGRCEQILAFSFDSTTGDINVRVAKSVLAQAGGGRSWCGPSPWFLAPRWTLNAICTAFTTAAERVTAIAGQNLDIGSPAGLAESQTTYGKRKLTIDAGPFHLDEDTCTRIANAVLKARYQPVRIYTYQQARKYPLRPNDGNQLIAIAGTSVKGVVIAWEYTEAHTPSGSASKASFRLREVATLPGLQQALAEDRLGIAALDQGVITG